MNNQEVKDYIKNNLDVYLEKVTQKVGHNTYICPLCGSGTGNNKHYTAAFTVKENLWHCFSCNTGGDIYNLIAAQYNLDIRKDFVEIFNKAKEIFGIHVDNTITNEVKNRKSRLERKNISSNGDTGHIDYTLFLKDCSKLVQHTDYFQKRGLTDEIINKFALGYITKEVLEKYRVGCNLEKYLLDGDIIIPYAKDGGYWIARETQTLPDTKREDNYMKWKKPKTCNAGKEPVFNEQELDERVNEPIFLTEAPLDSLSIIQAGGRAIAIGGTGIDKLSKALESRAWFSRPFILAFDNPEQDKGGRQITEQAEVFLKSKNISYISFKYQEGIKDCNEYLVKDKINFVKAVKDHINNINNVLSEQIVNYKYDKSAESYLQAFMHKVEQKDYVKCISTGFAKFDSALDGGLYPGLYCIGGISSLGKTTLMLQIADQIAKKGTDVLIITLEMSGEELVTKSLSRLTYKYCLDNNINPQKAKTMRGISDSSRWESYSKEEMEVIDAAIDIYKKEYATNIYIQESSGETGVYQICNFVEEHIKITGNVPVLIVDYLQILAPYNDRATDKQNVDKAVLELKRLSRDKKMPVIAVSSFNRDNYNHTVTMAAFKESGAIEYSSDVLLAIQPKGMSKGGTKKEVVERCKSENIRDIELVILKNRNSASGEVIPFKYYACYNYMQEQIGTKLIRDKSDVTIVKL